VAAVTADTNIYVSGLQFGGLPMQFLSAAMAGVFRLAVSEPLLAEVSRVLLVKFLWPENEIEEAMAQLASCTTLVHPTHTLSVVVEDPADDRILECAVTADSHYLVTGDNHLLRLGAYADIQIVRVAEFMNLLSRTDT
jgi:putative PIN family toxin of toxin-antitoxin system